MKKQPAKKKTELVIQKQTTLSLANPSDVMAFGQTLKSFITKNNLSVKIKNNDYSMVDGWKFAGLNFGLTAIPSKPVIKHQKGQYITVLYSTIEMMGNKGKYFKEVAVFAGFSDDTAIIEEVRKKNKITREYTRPYFAYECDCSVEKLSDHSNVTRGTGFCSNLELEKASFDEYSVISMAETRSIGKAYRNLLGFVMKAAGVESTPAEEMTSEMGGKTTEATVISLPEPTPKQFSGLMKRAIKEGATIIEEAKKHFTLSDDQITSLNIAIESKK